MARSGILVVDDNVASLRLIAETLAAEGYAVRPATGGEQALRAVDSETPELVLLDVQMPGLDGYEVCRRLQSDPARRSIPVLFLSASTESEEKVKGFQAGAVDFIPKPFQREELLARVRTHLELGRLRVSLEDKSQRLQQSLTTLEETTARLIESERLASLGTLVAGIAHELNTPLGMALTVNSSLQAGLAALEGRVRGESLSRQDLAEYLGQTAEGLALSLQVIERAIALVSHFRQVVVDDRAHKPEVFRLSEAVGATLALLSEELEAGGIQVEVDLLPDSQLHSFLGVFHLVLTHLVTNALRHAWPRGGGGRIRFQETGPAGPTLVLWVSDNGAGADAETVKRFFDPFFTTRNFDGMVGLGGYIIYNMVHTVLRGDVRIQSSPGAGFSVELRLPRDLFDPRLSAVP